MGTRKQFLPTILLPAWSEKMKLVNHPRFKLLVVTSWFGTSTPYLPKYKRRFFPHLPPEKCEVTL
jgi:hypothetical protein